MWAKLELEVAWYVSIKMTPTFGAYVFPNMRLWRSCAAYRKASSKDHLVHTPVSFRNIVQLHLWVFRSYVCVLWRFVCNGKATQSWKWFLQAHVFFFLYTYCRLCGGNAYNVLPSDKEVVDVR